MSMEDAKLKTRCATSVKLVYVAYFPLGLRIVAGPLPVLDLTKKLTKLSSVSDLFEVVADDLQTLNKNLQSIVGAENPVLMSAAEQIFGAGGKRTRPALTFPVSRATAEIAGLKDLTKEHRRLAEIIEIIHTSSLIHDDVLDESDLRRGKKNRPSTLWYKNSCVGWRFHVCAVIMIVGAENPVLMHVCC